MIFVDTLAKAFMPEEHAKWKRIEEKHHSLAPILEAGRQRQTEDALREVTAYFLRPDHSGEELDRLAMKWQKAKEKLGQTISRSVAPHNPVGTFCSWRMERLPGR